MSAPAVQLPTTCPDYCDGRSHDRWDIAEDGTPVRDHCGSPWEAIQGEGSAFYAATIFVFCAERYGEGLGRSLVNVHADTDLTPADAVRLAQQILSAARVAERANRRADR